jgi:hypothetical protein
MDFSHLSAAERAAAMQKLAAMLNALSLEERQKLRLDRTVYKWFDKMTEEEKGEFLEATMPTGFKQMLAAFEDMAPYKRKRVVDQAIRQMKDAREKMAAGGQMPPPGTNSVVLSPELQERVVKIGLKSYYSQSSAQAKAELAPLLVGEDPIYRERLWHRLDQVSTIVLPPHSLAALDCALWDLAGKAAGLPHYMKLVCIGIAQSCRMFLRKTGIHFPQNARTFAFS